MNCNWATHKPTTMKYMQTVCKTLYFDAFAQGTYLNKEGKTYRIVYDFAWMDFSDQKVLIVRKKNR